MARILMVNDEDDLLELSTLALGERGHEVIAAKAEAQAVGLAVAHRPDLLLVDLVVPGTSGERVAQAIRQRIGRVPLVVMSASADGAWRARAMGADAFVAKPFAEDDLVATVERLLAPPAAHGDTS
jgi:DNA-binding response OmpR family regulator